MSISISGIFGAKIILRTIVTRNVSQGISFSSKEDSRILREYFHRGGRENSGERSYILLYTRKGECQEYIRVADDVHRFRDNIEYSGRCALAEVADGGGKKMRTIVSRFARSGDR